MFQVCIENFGLSVAAWNSLPAQTLAKNNYINISFFRDDEI